MSIIVLVSGPAGSGKGTAIKGALLRVPGFRLARSLTTREPRKEDTMYDYATIPAFHAAYEAGQLLERNKHFHAWYGKRIPADDGAWLYELDVEGAEEIKKKYPLAKKVLILPPEPLHETIERRMIERAKQEGKELTAKDLTSRLERAEYEVRFAREHGVDLEITNYEGRQDKTIAQLVEFLRLQLETV